ncbi:MAG: hypothetical protein II480_05600, partial [Bacteroidales bacterium]|nr:hypothetical protein [Bacteroidales bacterium]
MGNEINTRTQLLLASYKDKMSASMQVAADNGKLKYSDGYYYKRIKLPLSANGMQDLLLNDDSQKDGFCSISKQKINQGCAFMADRFTFKVAVYTVPGSSPIAYDSWSEGAQVYTSLDAMDATVKAALAALTCAELEFTVNGDRQWIAPVNSFNQETVLSNSNKDGKNVSAPVFVNDEVLM